VIRWGYYDDLILSILFIMERRMVQPGTNDTKLDAVLKDLLDDFLCISNFKGNDEMRMFSLKITHELGEKIFSRDGACPQRKVSSDPLGEFAQGV